MRRQPTYWDLSSAEKIWRVNFRGKREAHFAAPAFAGLTVSADHPVLARYLEPHQRLFISSHVEDFQELLQLLESAVSSSSSGWRSLAAYANPDVAPQEILEQGHGLLLEAPRSAVDAVEAVLTKADIRYETIEGTKPDSQPLALILGRNFVVADHFDFVAPHAV